MKLCTLPPNVSKWPTVGLVCHGPKFVHLDLQQRSSWTLHQLWCLCVNWRISELQDFCSLLWIGIPHKRSLWSRLEPLCKCSRCACTVLGGASLVRLDWLCLQGLMIGCKPHWHPEQTTAGYVCVCAHMCVGSPECNTRRSLERSTSSLNLSESGVVGVSELTPTHTGGHTHSFWRPLSSMLGTSCTHKAQ